MRRDFETWIFGSFRAFIFSSVAIAGEPYRADLDLDGDVDFADFIDFAGQFGRQTGNSSLLKWSNRLNLFTGVAWQIQSVETFTEGISSTVSDSVTGILQASVLGVNKFFISWQFRHMESGTNEHDWWQCSGIEDVDLFADLSGSLSVTSLYSGETFPVTYTISRETIGIQTVQEVLNISWVVGGATKTFTWIRMSTPYAPGSVGSF